MTVNFSDQTFGIEIETRGLGFEEAARAIQTIAGGTVIRTRFWGVKTPDNRVWNVTGDSSIEPLNGKSAEIVSPICTISDLETVMQVVRALKAAGAETHQSCGIHIHVGVPGITGRELGNLAKIVDRQEEYIFKALGVLGSRKNRFAKPVEMSLINSVSSAQPQTLREFKKIWYGFNPSCCDAQVDDYQPNHYHDSRYHGLNLHAVFDKGTVEYRYFNGSLNPQKIKAYIQFCLALTAFARNAANAKAGRRQFEASSAKYDFRVFLTTLGLNGPEFKTCREYMVSRLNGDSAFKHGRPSLAWAA